MLGLRKMTWVLILWCGLILAWAVAGGDSANQACRAGAVNQLQRDACDAGTGIGVALVLFIGFVGFLFFALIWFMTRPKGRDCPACGELVKKGRTTCESCGFDLAAAARGTVSGTGVDR